VLNSQNKFYFILYFGLKGWPNHSQIGQPYSCCCCCFDLFFRGPWDGSSQTGALASGFDHLAKHRDACILAKITLYFCFLVEFLLKNNNINNPFKSCVAFFSMLTWISFKKWTKHEQTGADPRGSTPKNPVVSR
jgi:hypothetical protein